MEHGATPITAKGAPLMYALDPPVYVMIYADDGELTEMAPVPWRTAILYPNTGDITNTDTLLCRVTGTTPRRPLEVLLRWRKPWRGGPWFADAWDWEMHLTVHRQVLWETIDSAAHGWFITIPERSLLLSGMDSGTLREAGAMARQLLPYRTLDVPAPPLVLP